MRGKKSGASLEVVRPAGVVAIERPEPPPELTPEQAEVWITVVNRLPADWFKDETLGLLANYCRHVVNANHVAEIVDGLINGDQESEDWIKDYDRLLKMQERESRAIASLATKMRITQQSLYHKEKKRGSAVKKPHLL